MKLTITFFCAEIEDFNQSTDKISCYYYCQSGPILIELLKYDVMTNWPDESQLIAHMSIYWENPSN